MKAYNKTVIASTRMQISFLILQAKF